MRTARRPTLALVAAVLLIGAVVVGAVVAAVRFEALDRIRERVAPEPSPGCIADDRDGWGRARTTAAASTTPRTRRAATSTTSTCPCAADPRLGGTRAP
ncbi:hypothetical protein GCM10023175_43590 [Pseudonocardia xishanensis]|uniref:Uncharacterized protein n=1 Tax=Pseudonocardia xishanensis TaxID=630995 RepID=A0ABP8RWV6_9PSEU